MYVHAIYNVGWLVITLFASYVNVFLLFIVIPTAILNSIYITLLCLLYM